MVQGLYGFGIVELGFKASYMDSLLVTPLLNQYSRVVTSVFTPPSAAVAA